MFMYVVNDQAVVYLDNWLHHIGDVDGDEHKLWSLGPGNTGGQSWGWCHDLTVWN